jgi:hypothetical protein
MKNSPPDLDRVQRWMQAVLMHVQGVEAGLSAPAARAHLTLRLENLEDLICRSNALTSLERLQIYGNAYYARLLECLREEFPGLRHAVGDDAFDAFAVGYLQKYPSESYTLAQLAGRFPQFLTETRPADDEGASGVPTWPDFLIDLARLERIYSDVFDGPGVEGELLIQPAELQAIPPDLWPAVRLRCVPCFRLETFRYPVHAYLTAVRQKSEGAEVPLPAPHPTLLAITRRDYVVRRYPLTAVQWELLRAIAGGAALEEALCAAVAATEVEFEELAAALPGWFREWTAAPFFAAIEQPSLPAT